ncbi:hypothetical protein [Mycobacterium sp. 852002-40037_SCH5390672]|uniref:hypothetical protein n=1 Tax=Mycobacterium sp. 852002-40037_SCH5390672 TaxID=1834089 RepID=UPI000ACF1AF7|nr:hypothetical protein [Mycobacterium sp. 852002-40037_SCH5390672]
MSVTSDIAKATGLFHQGVDLMDSASSVGDLVIARTMLQDAMFELLDVKVVLPSSDPMAARLDETVRRGNVYLDGLDVFISEATG